MKRLFALLLAVISVISLAGCTQPQQEEEKEQAKDMTGKYLLDEQRNEAIISDLGTARPVDGNCNVFYHIFVGSFSDSNGDGIGDLQGIINRFDYINDGDPDSGVSLGVEGIWLSPIFLSPSYHKYDTTNYYTVDPQFGTQEDLKELIDLCHSRGVKIILDLVINHTGYYHQWFTAFKEAHKNQDPTDPYYDFYTCSSQPLAGRTFHKIGGTNEYFEGNFSGSMPELNYDSDAVRQAMVDLAKYYLDLGVDGFRFDAAKYIYYGDEAQNAEFWKWYMAQLRAIKPDIYTVAEVWDGDGVTYPYFASTNCFNFSLAQVGGKYAEIAKGGNVNTLMRYVENYLTNIKAENPNAHMVSFLANHDTDRSAGYLQVATGHAQMAANLSILMPGSTFIYYGEEIGMLGSRGGSTTDANRRLAMLWGDEDTVKNPVGTDYKAKQANGTVADQLPNGDSLYNHYKKLIAIRLANPEIAYGAFIPLKTSGKAGGFLCSYEGSTVAVLHNPTKDAATLDLSKLTDVEFAYLAAVVGLGSATLEGTTLTIDAQTSVVLRQTKP